VAIASLRACVMSPEAIETWAKPWEWIACSGLVVERREPESQHSNPQVVPDGP
jgi:hypothetical protein